MSQWIIWGSTRALLILTEYRTGKRTIWLADVPGPSELNQLCDKRSCEIWGSESVLWIVVGLMLRKYTLIRENGRYENIKELGNNSFNKWWLELITSILQSAVWAPLIAIANNIKLYVLEWNEPLSFMPFKAISPPVISLLLFTSNITNVSVMREPLSTTIFHSQLASSG